MRKKAERNVKIVKKLRQMWTLNRHKLSKHEGVRFPCEHCGAEFTAQGNLNKWVLAIAKNLKLENPQIQKNRDTSLGQNMPLSNIQQMLCIVLMSLFFMLYVYWSTSSFIYLLSWLWKKDLTSNVAGTNWLSMRVWGTLVTSVVLSSLRRETSEGTNFPNMSR